MTYLNHNLPYIKESGSGSLNGDSCLKLPYYNEEIWTLLLQPDASLQVPEDIFNINAATKLVK